MNNAQIAQLAVTRLTTASGRGATSPSVQAGANGAKKAIPGAAFTAMWYRHPERPMSQSERLPS